MEDTHAFTHWGPVASNPTWPFTAAVDGNAHSLLFLFSFLSTTTEEAVNKQMNETGKNENKPKGKKDGYRKEAAPVAGAASAADDVEASVAEDTGVGKFVCETGFARKERNKREGRRCSPFFDSVLPCFVGLFSLSVAEESHSRTDPLQIQRRKKNKTRRKKWRRNIAKEQEISNGTRQNNSGIRR